MASLRGQSPNVYTIAPGASFVDELAAGLQQRFGQDPLAFSRVTVLLPTRRAVKSLREAFLKLNQGKPMLLPSMQPVGDVDEDELLLQGGTLGGIEALDLLPQIPPLHRRLMLTRMVMHKAKIAGEDTVPAQAAALAEALGQFLDQVQTENLSFDGLQKIVGDEFASHWQKTLDFLKIITTNWPEIIAEQGYMDGASRRNLLLQALAERWRTTPPVDPVIAAGSTGSVPATADLLSVVARLPRGGVVLPGLHVDMDDESWQAIDATHPQYTMKQLLEGALQTSRGEVQDWSKSKAMSARSQMLREALRPAPTTDVWRSLSVDRTASLEGLHRIDAPGPRQEAGIIALILRHALETPDRTAALVTPDRQLARRVAVELQRWGIEIDDSAGQPLSHTPVGTFLRLTAEMIGDKLAPVSLLAALKHPLVSGGQASGVFRQRLRTLEASVLRGPRPGGGSEGITEALRASGDRAKLLVWWDGLCRVISRCEKLCDAGEVELADLLDAHMEMAEALARTDDADGAAQIWRGEAGEIAANFIADLREASPLLGSLQAETYPALLARLMEGQTVRPRYGRHPRLNIWGPLEARLQQADLVILGGLNEGVWPPDTGIDPWMSRPMRKAFGLPSLERRIGLSAHDFVQAASAPQVVLTRADKVDGTPTVPSRWLLRVDALLQMDKWPETPWARWYDLLDKPDSHITIGPPTPRPPVAARPTSLSVTQIQTWMQDPYALYARHILGLRVLDPLDAEPGAADKGNYIHDALDRFMKAYPGTLPHDALDRLIELGEAAFGPALARPTVWAFWWPRFCRVAEWFVAHERERRQTIKTLGTEIKASHTFQVPVAGRDHFPFTLRAKADRIDRLADGRLEIIDYKTGQAPGPRQLEAGYAPQMPLEGVLAQAGAFEGLEASDVAEIAFWRLIGGDPPVETVAYKGDVDQLVMEAAEGLVRLVAAFADEHTAYLAKPRPVEMGYADYDHLARVKEWSGVEAQPVTPKPEDVP